MKAVLSESAVTELRAVGCMVEQPLPGNDGIACRIIMPARELSTAERQEIFTVIVQSLNDRGNNTDHRSVQLDSI